MNINLIYFLSERWAFFYLKNKNNLHYINNIPYICLLCLMAEREKMKSINIKINREGLTNEEIKKVRELINEDLTSRRFKSLLNGNEFSGGVGDLELEFSIN